MNFFSNNFLIWGRYPYEKSYYQANFDVLRFSGLPSLSESPQAVRYDIFYNKKPLPIALYSDLGKSRTFKGLSVGGFLKFGGPKPPPLSPGVFEG